ncbi:vitelline membrane outer layer protein 1 isoform X2 [Carassius gibelio]|uniref:vitelline membrane outer layer protein 1 isoform X2 n=1 Tax=Carassius gibelio TaxID=101364 RepID=UPI0022797616|nr:vitelline membrane outer layer protein 1 isoform X2 [Carassius gibelio]
MHKLNPTGHEDECYYGMVRVHFKGLLVGFSNVGMLCCCFKVEETLCVIWDDNTALNGIRLHCIDPSKGSVQSEVGSWGKWTEIKWCPSGLLTAFQLRVESSQGIEDDTAVNNIRFRCSRGSLLEGDGTGWGEWGYMSTTCEGKAICGIQTQVEEPQGMRDDTALNDAWMLCCD